MKLPCNIVWIGKHSARNSNFQLLSKVNLLIEIYAFTLSRLPNLSEKLVALNMLKHELSESSFSCWI